MRIAVAMPVCVQEKSLERMTLEHLEKLQSRHRLAVFMSVNRKPRDWIAFGDEVLRVTKDRCFLSPKDRSVSASWNWAFGMASEWRANYVLILANDVALSPETVDALVEFGERRASDVLAWSGVAVNQVSVSYDHVGAGCDFSCTMMPLSTWERVGRFDENFRPGYFEDNDYVARIILSGSRTAQLGSAPFTHLGSQTIRQDTEMAHHKNHWWPKCQRYFAKKWGHLPVDDPAEMRRLYYATPYDEGGSIADWKQEVIHSC